ncbi:DNA repair protein ntg1 [Colletotrichum truncatum]|uniref:DNA repair protein ntg1 n=1 Tax=Colletotrichum truncatum TaxID=5467 RepID=A0ACC3ZF95_COLTU|nr:DNA repair protein ntg1 [Colletotrichum truncatum]KAF6801688.1 DNA repair protein ntg1 [Colletotrichum truncatum]
MRASRLSKETAAVFNKMAGSPPPPTRRTTRSSLARFAYTGDNSNSATESATNDVVLGDDIEDAITSTRSRKRRRVTKVEKEEDDDGTGDKKIKTEQAETERILTPTKPTQAKRVRKPARVIKGEDLRVEPPSDWEEIYNAVKEMRLHGPARDAAVDTMGCERLFHPDASERDRRFHILIALMLSSQTKDTVNAVAMKRLMTELPPHKEGAEGGLNLENVLAVEPALLNELIWAVGFHNNKTKYIKAAAEILRDKFNNDIPDTIEGLTSLPGVGPKMGYLCLSAAWDRTEGIGVDVHVHRITNLWGWHKTTQPEATRLALQSWLPREKWREINWLLVGFGQTVCLPVGRRCGDCELGLSGLCKAAERKKVIEGRKAREVKIEVDGDAVIKTEEVVDETTLRDEVVNEVVDPKSAPPSELGEQKSAVSEPTGGAGKGVLRKGRR